MHVYCMAIARQLHRVSEIARRLGRDDRDLPLFPTYHGEEVDKSMAVRTIYELARMIGEPLVDARGTHRFGGHSPRTGGAAMLAARGVHPYKVQALGRWRSSLVIRRQWPRTMPATWPQAHRPR